MPGTYILVDHSIFRTFNKGALGMLKVDGPENKLVYSGKEVDVDYISEKAGPSSPAIASAASALEMTGVAAPDLATRIAAMPPSRRSRTRRHAMRRRWSRWSSISTS